MQRQDPQKESNKLKDINFLCWHVQNVKDRRREQYITKVLTDRPRLRSTDRLN